LAWSGDVSQHAHSIDLPSDVGVCNHLESGIEVDVNVLDPKTLYEAVRVMVEPCTVDDWEMLDLNAGLVEAQMMNQVATVRENTIIPIWINSSTVVRMAVKETMPSGNVKLVDGTEVIVSPKPRNLPNGTSSNNENVSKPSIPRPKKTTLRIQHYFAGNASTHLICDRRTMKRLHWTDGLLVCVSSISNTLPYLARMNHSIRPTSTSAAYPTITNPNSTRQELFLRVFGSDSVQPNHALLHVNTASQLSLHQFSRFLVKPQPDLKNFHQLQRLLLKPVRWGSSSTNKIENPSITGLVEQINKWMSSNARKVHRNSSRKSNGSYSVPLTNGELIVLGGQHYVVYCNIVSLKRDVIDNEGQGSQNEETMNVLAEMNTDMNSDGTRTTSNLHSISSLVPSLPGMASLQQFDQVREAGARVLEKRTEGKMRASREASQLATQQEQIKDLFLIDSDAVFSNDTIEIGTTVDSSWLFPLDYFLPSKSTSSTIQPQNTFPQKLTSHSRTSSASAISVTTASPAFDFWQASHSKQAPQFPPSPFNGIASLSSNNLLFTTHDIGGLDKEIATSIDTLLSCLGRSLLKHQLGVKSGGMLLLTGQHGCGKSMMLRALGTYFSKFPEILSCPLYVSCSEFSGMKVGKIVETLHHLFQDAVFCQPSTIMLDDLDLLSPAENSESPQASAAKAHHSQILSVIFKFIDSIIEKGHQIAIVATSQSNTAVHADLLHPYYLLQHIPLHAPNMKSRVNIIQRIITRKGLLLCGDHGEIMDEMSSTGFSELSRVAIRTDGYLGGDIEQLIDRAVHAASVRLIESQTEAYMNGTNSVKDFTQTSSHLSQSIMPSNQTLVSTLSSTTTITTDIGMEETSSEHIQELNDASDVMDYSALYNYHHGNSVDINAGMRPAISAPLMLEAQEGFVPISLRGASLNVSSTTTWDDVGGLEVLKSNLRETIEWPTKYGFLFKNSPIRARSGILLFGPSGCGKTLVANAIAKECGLNFISVKGPELLNKYIGQSEQSVRDVFSRAQSASPCVLFFDEFDAIAPRRGHDNTGVTDRVVNQFLTELDGVEGLQGVYVLAASSRPELIDPALLRPGRLDKSYYIGYPGMEDREGILRALGRKMKFDQDVHFSQLAIWTENCTGADLQALLYNAQLEAIHERLDIAKREKMTILSHPNGHLGNGNASSSQHEYASLRSAAEQMLVLKYTDFKTTTSSGSIITSSSMSSASSMSIASKEQVLKKLEVIQQSLYEETANLKESNNSVLAANASSSEVLISMEHLKKAFANLTPSSSPSDRRRNEQIYGNFLVSRGTDFADLTAVLTNQKATLA
jgi:SpoVK/Ycf46/Vps4 family AAA+-type ATPase